MEFKPGQIWTSNDGHSVTIVSYDGMLLRFTDHFIEGIHATSIDVETIIRIGYKLDESMRVKNILEYYES